MTSALADELTRSFSFWQTSLLVYFSSKRGPTEAKANMSSQESEQVLTLLKELSVMKELDTEYENGFKTEPEREAYRLRQQRHQEITIEIKALAVQKRNGAADGDLYGQINKPF